MKAKPKGRKECVAYEPRCELLLFLTTGGCARLKNPDDVKFIQQCPIGNWKEK